MSTFIMQYSEDGSSESWKDLVHYNGEKQYRHYYCIPPVRWNVLSLHKYHIDAVQLSQE